MTAIGTSGFRAMNPKVAIRLVYVTAMFVVAMDGTVVNVSLLAICRELGVSPAEAGTVNIGYLVAVATTLPLAGWLGERFGGKRVLLCAIAVFTAASVCCGLAGSLEELIVFRVIKGAAGGLIAPVGMALLFRAFPPEERARLSRSLVLPIAVAPAVGPIVGGFFVETLSWRWCFYINLPIGAIAFVLGWLGLEASRPQQASRLDWAGLLLGGPGLAMAIYALSQGAIRGWKSPEIVIAGLTGIAFLIVMTVKSLRTPAPLLRLRLLSHRLYRTAGLIALCSSAGLLGMLYVFPLMYQDMFGASAFHTGLTTFTEAIGLMAASQCLPWSVNKFGVRRVVILALLCAIGVFGALSLVQAGTNPWLVRLLLLCGGFTLGHSVGAVQLLAFARVEPHLMGQATMLFQVQNRLGSALGVAVIGSVLAAGTAGLSAGAEQSAPAGAHGYQLALLASAAFLALAWGLALTLRKSDTAGVLPRRPQASAASEAAESAKAPTVST
ncbi:drug resistance transporter, EmrB/QacA subfamily [Paenibacillus sp. RU4T]|nr:multidrug efflux MFS transporter [Paenibacillus sp. RUD330]SIQ38851.1 drug resistance transporter, EmrB/QacA subfamily [Paenibacillus sp. RU4X]SIQ61041.1 drug resistance transporter, EmrB/QacA subfamily [Paenibacillus sp. RU4T]